MVEIDDGSGGENELGRKKKNMANDTACSRGVVGYAVARVRACD